MNVQRKTAEQEISSEHGEKYDAMGSNEAPLNKEAKLKC